MDHSAITFSLNRGDDGILTGFSLTAVGTEAECFCVSFLFAQPKKKARIEFADSKIIFIHDGLEESNERLGIYGSSEGGTYETTIGAEDAAALHDLLACRGIYAGASLKAVPSLAWSKGFELIADRNALPVDTEGAIEKG